MADNRHLALGGAYTLDIFAPALAQLKPGEWSLFGPTSFQGHLAVHGLTVKDTAAAISIDSLDRLPRSLRTAHTMVLRLGQASDGPGTQFLLVGTPNQLHDFFVIDKVAFTCPEPSTYLPEVSIRSLFPYSVFPHLTEKSVVNLAFSSGLIGHALGLDKPYPTAAPATGNGTYDFTLQVHSALPEVYRHVGGQVEVDAVFLGSRGGKECLFVVESKMGAPGSLAKHKLVYPVLALAKQVPADIPIVPVYIRIQVADHQVDYHVVECQLPDPRQGPISLDALRPVSHRFISLPLHRSV